MSTAPDVHCGRKREDDVRASGRRRLRALLRSYLPPGRAGRTFVLVALVDSVGTGLFLAGSVAFFIHVVGLDEAEVGVGLSVAGVAGLLSTVPIGLLVDRIGAKPMLILLNLWRAGWSAALAFTAGPLAFVIVSACLSVAERAVSPTSQALVGALMGDRDRVRTMAAIRSVRNVGFSLGSFLTVPLLAVGSEWTFRTVILGDGLSFVLAALLLTRLRVNRPPKVVTRGNAFRHLRGFGDRPYLALTVLNGIFTLHMTLLAVGLPLWAVDRGSPATVVPVLIGINTVVAVTLQVPFSRGSERPAFGARALRLCGWSLVTSCLVMVLVSSSSDWLGVAALVVGTLTITAAELWQAVGGWELSFRYAPEANRAEYLSVFSLGGTVQNIIGPLVMTAVVGAGNLGWLALAVVFVLAIFLLPRSVVPLERALNRRESGQDELELRVVPPDRPDPALLRPG